MEIQDGKDEIENCSLLYCPLNIFKDKDVKFDYIYNTNKYNIY